MTVKELKVLNVDMRIYKGTITFAEIAEELGSHRNTISRWFNDSEMDQIKKGIVRNTVDAIKEKKSK